MVNTSRKKYNFGETSVQNKRNQMKKELRFKVSTDKSDGSVLCSCLNFARFGFLCRHIFCVLKVNELEVIPDKYILKQCTRDLLPPHIRRKKQMFGFEGGRYMECSTTVYSTVEYCLNRLAKDEEKLIEFVEKVKRLKTEVEEANPNAKQLSKREMFNLVLEVKKPEVNTVKNPKLCSNKGNASGGQRKKSEIEKLREHMKKHKRLCKKM
nr:FAR1 DNA binding domain, zinc finger, SWIM-type, MULE transposase domain, FHY3/FAR1 family [Tanacetum cinerariifolium]